VLSPRPAFNTTDQWVVTKTGPGAASLDERDEGRPSRPVWVVLTLRESVAPAAASASLRAMGVERPATRSLFRVAVSSS
jgi:hypothetical protein